MFPTINFTQANYDIRDLISTRKNLWPLYIRGFFHRNFRNTTHKICVVCGYPIHFHPNLSRSYAMFRRCLFT